MKQMKNYLFLFIAFLGILFSGCEKDLYEDAIPIQNYAVKEYTFQEALQKQEFKTSYTKFDDQIKKLKTANRGAGDTIEDYNFIIDSSKIKEIVYDSKTSYTMAIKRDEITKGYFENLILEINSLNEKQAYIIKYFPSEEMKYNENHQEFEFVGTTVINKVHGPTTFFGEGGSSEYDEDNSGPGILTITCVSYLQCCQTQNGSVGSYHNLGPTCTDGAFIRLVVVCSQNGIPIGGSGSNTTGPSGFLGGGNGPSGQGSSSSNYNPTPTPTPVVTAPVISILNPPITDCELNAYNTIAEQFYNPIFRTKKMYLHTTLGLYQALTDFLSLHITNGVIDAEALDFANEIVDLSINDANQADVYKLASLSTLINDSENNLFEDSFITSLDPYIDFDLTNPSTNITPNFLGLKIFFKYKQLRQINPEWSRAKCIWHASRNIVHLSLDAFGLIPLGGEIADLANGVLYTIEGDGLNATLSYASAIPIVGWAPAGTRFGLKVVNVVNDINSKVKLVWKVLPNNVIYFGAESTCRTQLRKILGLEVGNPLIAHHIMPISLQTNDVIQKAAKSGNAFHLNEALNGLALNSLQHNGNHANYITAIRNKLNNYLALNQNATPIECYNYLISLINDVKSWIVAHPNTNINLMVLP